MSPLRILHVHTDLCGGGIEKSLVTLATHMPDGETAICWCPTSHPPPPAEVLEELERSVTLIRIPPPFLSPAYAFRLRRAIRAFRPTVLHLHGASVGIVGSLVGRLARVPVIVYTEHCEPSLHARWLQRGRELTAGLPHHTVCVSAQIRRAMQDTAAFRRLDGRLSVIHNGLAMGACPTLTGEEKRALRRELGLPEQAALIGSVGLLWHVKGYEYLLRAMPAILARHPHAALALIGGGEDETRLRELAAALEIAARVYFLGWRGDVSRILPALDLYVQPSLSEGLPMSILEAAAAGLPIVASAVGGIAEVLTEAGKGTLVPPREVGALAEALNDLLDDRARARSLGDAARHHVVAHFSAEAMAAAYGSLYHQLLPAVACAQPSHAQITTE